MSNLLGLPNSAGGEPGLFVATRTGAAFGAEEGLRLGSATGLMAPAWARAYGPGGASLVALARSNRGSKPLVVRGIDANSGTVRDPGVGLPANVGGSGTIAVRWDLARGRLVVMARHGDTSSSGRLDYWLVQFRGNHESFVDADGVRVPVAPV